MKRILLVEDDPALAEGLQLALRGEDRGMDWAPDLADARPLLQGRYDLVILDISLPDGSGLELCREIRRHSSVPILFLSAKNQELDIVSGLELGADDYITKPFTLAILRARISALLRRGEAASPREVQLGGLRIDFARMECLRDGSPIELSRTEWRLLRLLVENQGRTLPREFLLDRVWGTEEFVEENALSVTVKRLRNKLEPDSAQPRHIRTVYGIGYCWKDDPEG